MGILCMCEQCIPDTPSYFYKLLGTSDLVYRKLVLLSNCVRHAICACVWCAFSNVVLCPEGNHSNLQGTGLSVTNSQFEKWISVDKFLWYSYSLLSARTKLEVALRKIMLWIPHHIMTITLFVEHSKSVVGDQLEFMYMACICTLIPHCKHSK